MAGRVMKRILAFIILAAALLMPLSGCEDRKARLIGDWTLVSEGGGRFGYMLRFEKSGAMYCMPGLTGGVSVRSVDEEFGRMRRYYSIYYNVKTDRIIELRINVFDNDITLEIDYSVDGDVLVFDGTAYRRIV
jgi:uncharacterized SAM-binding protein YcdF (DUF218 family)